MNIAPLQAMKSDIPIRNEPWARSFDARWPPERKAAEPLRFYRAWRLRQARYLLRMLRRYRADYDAFRFFLTICRIRDERDRARRLPEDWPEEAIISYATSLSNAKGAEWLERWNRERAVVAPGAIG